MPKVVKAKNNVVEEDNDQESLTYELGYLVVPTVGEEELSSEVSTLRGSIERSASVPFSEEFPSKRSLAYKISRSQGGHREHYQEAYFGWVKFDSLPSNIEIIKKDLEGNDKILRYLIIKVPKDSVIEKVGSIRSRLIRKKEEHTVSAPKEHPKEESAKKEDVMSDEELDKTIEDLIG